MKNVSVIVVLLLILTGCAVIAGCATNPPSTTPTPTPTFSSFPSPSQTVSPGTTTQGGGGTVSINLVALNIAFDQSTITVLAGAHVVMVFDNQDAGVIHNFSLYTDSSAKTKLFAGDFVTGPKKITYTFDAPSTPGRYFFRCDVHPTAMFGTFVVT